MSYRPIAIAGIHTDIGKTIVSAVLAEAWEADYWKPVQAGNLEQSDTMTLRRLISNPQSQCHAEAIALQMAASPHTAAASEGKEIDFTRFSFPQTDNLLLIETAGGLLSPINNTATMADFISYYQLPALLVTRHYLGSINHTLLCLEVMKNRNIPLLCILISGQAQPGSESFIRAYAGSHTPMVHIPELTTCTPQSVAMAASYIRSVLPKEICYGS